MKKEKISSIIFILSLTNLFSLNVFAADSSDLMFNNLKLIFSFLSAIGFLFIYGIVAIVILIICVKHHSEQKQKKEYIEQNPQFLNNVVAEFVPSLFTPAEFAAHCSENVYLSFFTYLAEMEHLNIVKFSPNYQYIKYPINYNCQNYQACILSILEDCRISIQNANGVVENIDGFWILPISSLLNYFRKFFVYFKIKNNFKALAQSKLMSLGSNFNFVKFNQHIVKIKEIAQITNNYQLIPTVELSTLINNQQNVLLPLYYCVPKSIKSQNVTQNESSYITTFAIDTVINFEEYNSPD